MKSDKMWVKFIHEFYMKRSDVKDYMVKGTESWMLEAMLKCRLEAFNMRSWQRINEGDKFPTRTIYKELMEKGHVVTWRKLVFSNGARPRALFHLWMVCMGRLYTKDRLARFGLVNDGLCVLCNRQESISHLFFECPVASNVWQGVLQWMQIVRKPENWECEMQWMIKVSRGKGPRCKVLKCAFAKASYMIWWMRNKILHGGGQIIANA